MRKFSFCVKILLCLMTNAPGARRRSAVCLKMREGTGQVGDRRWRLPPYGGRCLVTVFTASGVHHSIFGVGRGGRPLCQEGDSACELVVEVISVKCQLQRKGPISDH